MMMHFGNVPILIASSAEAAREIMKHQDLVFSNRPELSIPSSLLYNSKDVGFAPYGEYWRQVRSICVVQLLSNKRVQSYRHVREEETSIMVDKIQRSSSTVVNMSDVLMTLTGDVISRVALGKKYGEVRDVKNLFLEFGELLGASPLWEYIPWLSWIRRFDGIDARVEKVVKAFDEFLETVIHEHRVGHKVEGDDSEFDFVDILLEFQRENESRAPVQDDTIKALLLVSFNLNECANYYTFYQFHYFYLFSFRQGN